MQPFTQITFPCIYMSKKEDAGEERSGWMLGDWHMKQMTQCCGELEHQNERLAPHGQARTRSQRLSTRGKRGKDQETTEQGGTSCTPARAEPRETGKHTLPRKIPPDPWEHPSQGRAKGEIRQEDQAADNWKRARPLSNYGWFWKKWVFPPWGLIKYSVSDSDGLQGNLQVMWPTANSWMKGRLKGHDRFFRRFSVEFIVFYLGQASSPAPARSLDPPLINGEWQASFQRQDTQLRHVTARDRMKDLK